jgi:hypothetical protein
MTHLYKAIPVKNFEIYNGFRLERVLGGWEANRIKGGFNRIFSPLKSDVKAIIDGKKKHFEKVNN